jgi:hypothetical protein
VPEQHHYDLKLDPDLEQLAREKSDCFLPKFESNRIYQSAKRKIETAELQNKVRQ